MADWTTADDVVAQLRRRWDRGELVASASGVTEWSPVSVRLRGPSARELANQFGAVQDWAARWRADGRGVRVEWRPVGGRLVGTNKLPAVVWVDSAQQLCSLLRVGPVARSFNTAHQQTTQLVPALADWAVAHSATVLRWLDDWEALLRTVRWLDEHSGSGSYLRQIDVPAVDTKFIESHRGILATLLDQVLPAGRVTASAPPARFATRYGFADKPDRLRMRALAGDVSLGGPFTDVTVPAGELAHHPIAADTVFVVENEVTFLAFPTVSGGLLLLGGGYAVSRLAALPWLAERRLVYWGDLDTHGFAILHRLRSAYPHTHSILMDRPTLLAHRSQWVAEPQPVRDDLPLLTEAEAAAYDDLRHDAHGDRIRLEQERIRFDLVRAAVATR
ncbi:hypothetical protein Athai_46430 [Actinocatenispora thailandica]|uniref:DUF3322 and DUF2220 domain-containing protein n=1 Tax=Actinocatenispora thailandica TaxID=227318 RepID=A0A7R7DSM5_9ACTN|nr:Wadjet anti-phage system protein JetD domain-containing protein [Actinocatenispora thailandica]BCJ37140.1 hypothetical protein Athai_46430 [Actinocatenispora thailandica]